MTSSERNSYIHSHLRTAIAETVRNISIWRVPCLHMSITKTNIKRYTIEHPNAGLCTVGFWRLGMVWSELLNVSDSTE